MERGSSVRGGSEPVWRLLRGCLSTWADEPGLSWPTTRAISDGGWMATTGAQLAIWPTVADKRGVDCNKGSGFQLSRAT